MDVRIEIPEENQQAKVHQSMANKQQQEKDSTKSPRQQQHQSTNQQQQQNSNGETCASCRICFEVDQPLVRVCQCKGTLEFVHLKCIQEWIQTSRKRSCELCKAGFRYKRRCKPRKEWKKVHFNEINPNPLPCLIILLISLAITIALSFGVHYWLQALLHLMTAINNDSTRATQMHQKIQEMMANETVLAYKMGCYQAKGDERCICRIPEMESKYCQLVKKQIPAMVEAIKWQKLSQVGKVILAVLSWFGWIIVLLILIAQTLLTSLFLLTFVMISMITIDSWLALNTIYEIDTID